MLLRSRDGAIELVGEDVTFETNFAHEVVRDVVSSEGFLARIRFPSHGVIVIPAPGGEASAQAIERELLGDAALARIEALLSLHGAVHLEADMRAHRNPTRMEAIRRAAMDLAARAASGCPRCARPGFWVKERLPGLRCEACGLPTRVVRAEIYACEGCGRAEERPPRHGRAAVSPGECDVCNP